jgi:hypothetical protein
MNGGKTSLRVRVQKARERNSALQQPSEPLPGLFAALTATIQNSLATHTPKFVSQSKTVPDEPAPVWLYAGLGV